MPDLPPWRVPPDLAERLATDEVWEDERYAPIRLLVGGSPMYWQVELYPGTRTASDAAAGGPAIDGCELYERCLRYVAARDSDLAMRIHDDSENATCVLWVETQADGEALIALVWSFIYGAGIT